MAEASTRIPLFRPAIADEAADAVAEVLRSGWIGSGALVEEFEREFAALTGAAHVVAVSSGTAALHLAMRVLGLSPRTEVVTTPLTWLSTHHAIAYEGCVPILADIEAATGNLDVADVERRLTSRTGAVLALHYAGYPCDLAALRSLTRHAGIALVEDCAHAVGASFGGRPVGSGSNLQCFSFSPTKNLTTADGGAVVTGDPDQAARLRRLRSLGLGRTTSERMRDGGGPYRERYGVDEVGFRYEMSELHAAIGLAQMSRLGDAASRRAEIVAAYVDGLGDVDGLELLRHDDPRRVSANQMFVVLADDRERLAEALSLRGVEVGVHYPVNDLLATAPGELPAMDRFAARTLTLPLHAALTDGDVAAVIAAVREGW